LKQNEVILEGIDLHRSFQTGATRLHVLKGVNLRVYRGEMVAVIGASGVGKSTLLHILGALDQPDKGKVSLNHADVFSMDKRELAHFRNRTIGFVFQFHHLLAEFTALENVIMPKLIAGEEMTIIKEKGEKILAEVGLLERKEHRPGELSGGEQQRLAVARALINDPQILVADEPSGNLDKENKDNLHQLFTELNENKSQTIILATHNQELAQRAERIYRLKDGKAEVI
jgi:lipoprotein-releasing system ATP-binding protein